MQNENHSGGLLIFFRGSNNDTVQEEYYSKENQYMCGITKVKLEYDKRPYNKKSHGYCKTNSFHVAAREKMMPAG